MVENGLWGKKVSGVKFGFATLASCVTLNKLLKLSVPQFIHL